MTNETKKKNEAAATSPHLLSQSENDTYTAGDVQALVDKAVADAISKIANVKGEGGDEVKFARLLAMEMARMADQGTGRKRVSPEIQQARDEARRNMVVTIIEHKQTQATGGDAPRYKLRHKVYLAEQLIDPFYIDEHHMQQPQEIAWWGIPNEAMEPINEPADRIFKLFTDSIGDPTLVVAPDRDLAVTAGGLTVLTGNRTREAPQTGGARSDMTNDVYSDLAGVRGRNRPTKRVNILGTHAPAVEQTL